MFTGLVEKSAQVLGVTPTPAGVRLAVAHDWTDVVLGESIAINGVCLTVSHFDASTIHFDAIPETLSKTNLGQLHAGEFVHVERALRVGDRLGGHIVQGHVDGLATVVSQTSTPTDWRLRAKAAPEFTRYLVPKGSITLDGVSLTLAKVEGEHFEIALIPTTLQITQLGRRLPGSNLNVEFDMTVKTVVHYLEQFIEHFRSRM